LCAQSRAVDDAADQPTRNAGEHRRLHPLVLTGATGARDDAFAGTAVAPALSPCHPLLMPMSCELRRSLEIVIRPPRFGTSCQTRPLDCDRSTGFTMKKLAMYSTFPFALRGAMLMSVMSSLCE